MEPGADATALLEALPEPAFLLMEDGTVGVANRMAWDLTGSELGGQHLSDFHVGDKASLNAFLKRCRGSKSVLVGSLHLQSGQVVKRLQCHGCRVTLASGTALLLRLVQVDETRFKLLTAKVKDLDNEVKQRRHAQAILNESLQERDLLLRELQHRVKNNMHLLAAMLAGMERESTSLEAKSALRDAGARFGAVSAVQQLLYGSNLESVDSEALIATITKSACSLAPEKIDIDLQTQSFLVPISIATSIALILNEILTNAVKYGRPAATRQRIAVECGESNGRMLLLVADNGPGFNLQEAGKRASGIGLVRGLIRQLGGSFTVEQRSGARCKVEIPLPKDVGKESSL